MTLSFDTLFNEMAAVEQGMSLLYKGHARQALRYANFDLSAIDNPELARSIIQKAVKHAMDSTPKMEKTSFSVGLPTKPGPDAPKCPRCATATMQNIELLGKVQGRYCTQCRLTEIV